MAYDKEVKTSFLGDMIYSEHQLPKQIIMDHLHKIYDGFIYSIANNDHEFLSEYVESGFYDKLTNQLDRLNQ